MKPSDYDLPHDEWRKGQAETIDHCLSIDGTSIIESPTGSGKTSFAAAAAHKKSVISLCRTKNLQAENYGKTYGFDVLYGRANYPCVHPDAPAGATCADCLHQDNMYQCPLSKSCEYMAQKALCKASSKVSLNYSYWFTARWPRENPPQMLFLDECHEVPEAVLAFTGCTITDRDRTDWQLAEFPELRPSRGGGMMFGGSDPLPEALGWLEDTRFVLGRHWKSLKNASTQGELRRKHNCERLGRKVGNTLAALRQCSDDWYIRSGRDAQKYGRERRPAFVCKPLTARHHADGFFGFNNGQTAVLMSATIGDFAAFSDELGITEYDSLIIPNQFMPEERSVYVLDVPSMGSKASELAFEKQADEIAENILACPSHWPGIVHITRKSESKLLADRLARRGLQDRVWTPPGSDGSYQPTDKQVAAWQNRKLKVPNSIAISWSMWMGYDGLDEKICIAAKCPFPLWGSPGSYEADWRSYSMARYRWSAANILAQGLGRTRRGREQDYDVNGSFAGFCAIADASYNQIRNSLPAGLREALVV